MNNNLSYLLASYLNLGADAAFSQTLAALGPARALEIRSMEIPSMSEVLAEIRSINDRLANA